MVLLSQKLRGGALVLWCLLIMCRCCQGIDLIDQSEENHMIPKAQELTLNCEADMAYEFCKWTLPSGVKCSMTADDIGTELTCTNVINNN